PGDRLEYMGRNLTNIPFKVTDINDPKGNSLLQANPNMEITMHTRPIVNWEKHAIIRKIQPENKAS
ncbi:MAG: U32 family peptidase C-terminal domain-containing protein, partial [Deltaproteobacteria bacterium]|nr:U32 family peptidase C-terminal domain-containing protein [Deltaproteobacteria bacterium]